ncbi:hypothetical protein [Streptomyces iconiensis]|uniref:LigA protein n=1 Tax=Streptomyces iconiensis TaxID=1384038 RepID=A0ABT6ZWT4_9ACTN|nr:hypothetical protein [Streptomyces iconiensis]MDJ1133091.1 hypothetical protein [Streptomyces iconiensis]
MRRTKTLLAALTVAACLPYLALKLTWLSGGTTGIPEGSTLRDSGDTLWVLNAVTVAMDATVVLLVFALTRAWGRRLPAALLALPLWAATGLLGPIVVAFPAQALYGAVSGADSTGGVRGTDAADMLDGWVWTVVYTGFSVQALALGGLFVLYVRDRWGTLLRTRLGALPVPPRVRAIWRPAFAAGALLALASAVPHLLWAVGAGADVGPCPTRGAEQSADSRLVEGAFALFTLVAVAGLRQLTRGNPQLTPGETGRRSPRLGMPLAAAWIGTGVMTCWALWLLVGALTGGGRAVGQRASGCTELVTTGQLVAGLLLTLLGAHALRQRANASGTAQDRTAPDRTGGGDVTV